ncbi:hypothetical protein [Nocardia sp. NPDC023988]|uniref:hypothetical protein n=1 Tax=unclassified Nocardia TaxID=2637762 RepID=UPI0033D0E428
MPPRRSRRATSIRSSGCARVDANIALGLPVDARDYSAAAQMLRDLDVTAVRLMTNNPDKAKALADNGIRISGLLPLTVEADPHRAAYLFTKRERMGHALPDPAVPVDNGDRLPAEDSASVTGILEYS